MTYELNLAFWKCATVLDSWWAICCQQTEGRTVSTVSQSAGSWAWTDVDVEKCQLWEESSGKAPGEQKICVRFVGYYFVLLH